MKTTLVLVAVVLVALSVYIGYVGHAVVVAHEELADVDRHMRAELMLSSIEYIVHPENMVNTIETKEKSVTLVKEYIAMYPESGLEDVMLLRDLANKFERELIVSILEEALEE